MSEQKRDNSVIAAGVAAIVSGGLVYAALALWQPAPGGAAFENAVRDYLVSNPEVLVEVNDALNARRDAEARTRSEEMHAVSQQALEEIGADALLDPMVAYVEGPDDATMTVVEFFDYRCGYCKASLPAMKAVLESRDDVRFAFIEYPILTEQSAIAAHAAVAARRQPGMYMPFHLALMEAQGDLPRERILAIAEDVGIDVEQLVADMEDPEVMASLDASLALADTLQIGGTPTFVINGEVRAGAVDEATLNALIDGAES